MSLLKRHLVFGVLYALLLSFILGDLYNAYLRSQLPIGECAFAGTRWQIEQGMLYSSMSTPTMVNVNGSEVKIMAYFPTPSLVFDLKLLSDVLLKQVSWQHAIIPCAVDLVNGRAYPQPYEASAALDVFILIVILVSWTVGR